MQRMYSYAIGSLAESVVYNHGKAAHLCRHSTLHQQLHYECSHSGECMTLRTVSRPPVRDSSSRFVLCWHASDEYRIRKVSRRQDALPSTWRDQLVHPAYWIAFSCVGVV
jgi:hypothetical protein